MMLVFGAGGGKTKVETLKTSMMLVFGAGGGKTKVETLKTSRAGALLGRRNAPSVSFFIRKSTL